MKDYVTIYEHSVNGSDIWHIFPLLLSVAFGFGIVYMVKKYFRNFSVFRQIVLFFGWSFGMIASIMLIVFLIGIPSKLKTERDLKKMIENESFLRVEGVVESFESPNDNHHFESFSVDGIEFKYSDYIAIEGFHKTSKNNGPIKGNGQKVRIGYTIKDNENRIIKLEILKDD